MMTSRCMMACAPSVSWLSLFDYAIVLALCVPMAVLVFFIGILPWASASSSTRSCSCWSSFVSRPVDGGPNQATPGMRMMGIRLARLDGRPVDFMLAVVHGVLFWALNAVLTPFILLATLVLDRKQTVHDWLLGTVVVRG